jgi:hypothetical protein
MLSIKIKSDTLKIELRLLDRSVQMTFNRNLIAVVVLVLFAATLLISSLDYTSGIIASRGEPGNISSNYTDNTNYYTSEKAGHGGTPTPILPVETDNGSNKDPWAIFGLQRDDPGNGDSSADVRDSGNSLLIIGIIVAGMAIIAIIAFIIIRKRRSRNVGSTTALPVEPTPSVPVPVPVSCEGCFQLRFPRILEPFPNTWGVDEPLEMAISCKDEATGEAILSIDGEEARKVLLENGRAIVSLMLKKGEHKVTVSATAGPSGDSWVTVRIVDYREEIVRMFNKMCQSILPAGDRAGDELTPREIERSVGAQLPEPKRRQLDNAVTTFELANYSVHEIRRTDFERMYTSELGIQ